MGRPGLTLHRKFKWLALQLEGAYVARGVLELLWEAAYDSGEERVGFASDIAVAVGWRGDPERLARALVDAGGPGQPGFLEAIPEEKGAYRIHDLYDHAPSYVVRRMEREKARVVRGQSISDVRRAAGRKGLAARAAKQPPASEIQLPANVIHLHVNGMQTDASDATPLSRIPSPASPLPHLEDLAVVAPGTHTPPLGAATTPTTTPTTLPPTVRPVPQGGEAPVQKPQEAGEQAAVLRLQGHESAALPRLQGEVSVALARLAGEYGAAGAQRGGEISAAVSAPAARETLGERAPTDRSARAARTSAVGAGGESSAPGNGPEREAEEGDDMPDDPKGDGFKLAPAPTKKPRKKSTIPPGAPTREQAEATIAAASSGRYVAGGRDVGGTFKLDKARRDHPDGTIFARVGAWLGAGGDAWRGTLDGRALGKDLDGWIAQAKAWDGTSAVERGPPVRRKGDPCDTNSSLHVPNFDDIEEGIQR